MDMANGLGIALAASGVRITQGKNWIGTGTAKVTARDIAGASTILFSAIGILMLVLLMGFVGLGFLAQLF